MRIPHLQWTSVQQYLLTYLLRILQFCLILEAVHFEMKFKNQRMLNFTIASPLRQMRILIEISTWQNTSNRNKNYFNPGYIKSSMQQFRLKEKKKRGTQGSSTVTLKSLCTFVDLSPFFHFSQFLCGSIAVPFIATGIHFAILTFGWVKNPLTNYCHIRCIAMK